MPEKPKVKITALCGSLRKGSYTQKLLEIVLLGAEAYGAGTQLCNLGDYDLVFCGEVPEKQYPPDVFRLREDIRTAHGIVIGTPEYHGGVSGVLKNALDLMGFREFEGKMLGLIGVAGGKLGAINSLNSLRHTGRHLHAWVLPQQVSVGEVHTCFDADGNLLDKDIHHRCLNIGRLVAKFATIHEMEKDQAFIKLWESLPANPGGIS